MRACDMRHARTCPGQALAAPASRVPRCPRLRHGHRLGVRFQGKIKSTPPLDPHKERKGEMRAIKLWAAAAALLCAVATSQPRSNSGV